MARRKREPVPSQGWERERRIGHRVTAMCISHIEAPFNPSPVVRRKMGRSVQHAGVWPGAGEATGYSGWYFPLTGRSCPVFRQRWRGLHTKVQECDTKHIMV